MAKSWRAGFPTQHLSCVPTLSPAPAIVDTGTFGLEILVTAENRATLPDAITPPPTLVLFQRTGLFYPDRDHNPDRDRDPDPDHDPDLSNPIRLIARFISAPLVWLFL